jgi:hypothetical protein
MGVRRWVGCCASSVGSAEVVVVVGSDWMVFAGVAVFSVCSGFAVPLALAAALAARAAFLAFFLALMSSAVYCSKSANVVLK